VTKDLGSLIRLVQWRVDEKRRELGDAQREADACRQALVDLGAELKREQAAARASYEAGQGYANYARLFLRRREVTEAAIRAADAEVERLRDELAGLFLELKQAEITQANREKREAQRLAKLEQTELDEMGIDRFQRAKKAQSGESRG
jgi:flagellar FliJ protein